MPRLFPHLACHAAPGTSGRSDSYGGHHGGQLTGTRVCLPPGGWWGWRWAITPCDAQDGLLASGSADNTIRLWRLQPPPPPPPLSGGGGGGAGVRGGTERPGDKPQQPKVVAEGSAAAPAPQHGTAASGWPPQPEPELATPATVGGGT